MGTSATPNAEFNITAIIKALKFKKFMCICGADKLTDECFNQQCSFEHVRACWHDRAASFMQLVERDFDHMNKVVYDSDTLYNDYFMLLSADDQKVIRQSVQGCKRCGRLARNLDCKSKSSKCVSPNSNVILNYLRLF
jgi:hypothetical protein